MWIRPIRSAAPLLAAAVASCAQIVGGGPHLSLALTTQPGVALPLTLEADIDGQRVRLEASSAEPSPRMDVVANGFGEAPVALTLSTSGDTLGSVEISHSLRRGSVHWVTAVVGRQRPLGHCIGSLAVVPLETRAGQTTPDTMFVTYGSMPRSAIC